MERQLVQRVGQLRAVLEHAEASATSRDHAVTVTVRPGNAVSDITLIPERVRRHDGESLAAAIVDTIEQAATELETTLDQQAAGLIPDGFDLTGLLSGTLLSDPSDSDSFELAPFATGLSDETEDPPAEQNLGHQELPEHHRIGDPSVFAELERAQRLLARVRAEADRQRAAYQEVQDELPELRGRSSTLEGMVEASTQQGKAVSELHIADRALRMPKRLGVAVLEAIQRAQGDLATQLAGRLTPALGGIDLASMVAEYQPEDDDQSLGIC